MLQAKGRVRSSLVGWIFSALLIVASAWLWLERQYVLDAVQYYQYSPTSSIKEVVKTAHFTDDAIFTFYATHPAIESSQVFNQHCERKEANSPILGCYSANRIYIYDITDSRLVGIKTVTAAHELLHAEYERLPDAEKKRLEPLLESEYRKSANEDLKKRMQYYDRNQPGEKYNELHSIVGTEFTSVGPELEKYYRKYFSDRKTVAELYQKVERVFNDLSKRADQLVKRIDALATIINSDTKAYNTDVALLNTEIDSFNKRAAVSGGFTSQAEFQAARAALVKKSNELSTLRQKIQSNMATYKTLTAELDAINAQSASLNKGLDSNLSDAPTI